MQPNPSVSVVSTLNRYKPVLANKGYVLTSSSQPASGLCLVLLAWSLCYWWPVVSLASEQQREKKRLFLVGGLNREKKKVKESCFSTSFSLSPLFSFSISFTIFSLSVTFTLFLLFLEFFFPSSDPYIQAHALFLCSSLSAFLSLLPHLIFTPYTFVIFILYFNFWIPHCFTVFFLGFIFILPQFCFFIP